MCASQTTLTAPMDASILNTANKAPTVCLLTAGRGSRMGLRYPFNKALLPLGGKAILSLIVEKFPAHSHFIIGLGFCGKQVRDYLSAAHPTHDFQFVSVNKLEGPGSGPGRSLLECRDWLETPFFFVACDTLWEGEIPLDADQNWIAVASALEPERPNYCNVRVENGFVRSFVDKEEPSTRETKAFIGLAYIKDTAAFFEGLQIAESSSSELQVSQGLNALIPHGISTLDLIWLDVGTHEKYKLACAKFDAFDFGKEEEFLYFSEQRVIKFFRSPDMVKGRVARSRLNPGVFPNVDFVGQQFYAYRFMPGKTLYDDFSLEKFTQLLAWLGENLWLAREDRKTALPTLCQEFYRGKTEQRMELWRRKFSCFQESPQVNGRARPTLASLLERMPWDSLYHGVPRFIHGDLQPDNILCTPSGFLLLDWRQDFAGELEFGDLYYDLAKLRGGLLANYRRLKEGDWRFSQENEDFSFRLPSFPGQMEALAKLDEFVQEKGLDLLRIKLLTGVIFANMAPLHAAPFHHLFWHMARECLAEELGHGS